MADSSRIETDSSKVKDLVPYVYLLQKDSRKLEEILKNNTYKIIRFVSQLFVTKNNNPLPSQKTKHIRTDQKQHKYVDKYAEICKMCKAGCLL